MVSDNFMIELVKLLDIALLGIYFFIGGVIISKIINNYIVSEYNEEEYNKKSKLTILGELLINTALITTSAYLLRQLVKKIPFIFDKHCFGNMCYNHKQVMEIKGGVVIAFAVIVLQTNYKKKLVYLFNKN